MDTLEVGDRVMIGQSCYEGTVIAKTEDNEYAKVRFDVWWKFDSWMYRMYLHRLFKDTGPIRVKRADLSKTLDRMVGLLKTDPTFDAGVDYARQLLANKRVVIEIVD